MFMKINGHDRNVSAVNVAALLIELGLDATRVAIELNLVIVRQADFAQTPLAAGDTIEIVQFVGGG